MPKTSDGPDAWLLYRQTVPPEVRERIKELVLEASIDGFDDFLQVTVNITAEILAGDIHPEVAKEARSYLELALTAVTAKAMQDAAKPEGSTTNARLARARARRGALPAPQAEVTLDVDFTQIKDPVLATPAPWESDSEEP